MPTGQPDLDYFPIKTFLPCYSRLYQSWQLELNHQLEVLVHTFNPSSWEAESGQPGLHSKFQDSQGCTEKPCLKLNKKKMKGAGGKKEGRKDKLIILQY